MDRKQYSGWSECYDIANAANDTHAANDTAAAIDSIDAFAPFNSSWRMVATWME